MNANSTGEFFDTEKNRRVTENTEHQSDSFTSSVTSVPLLPFL